ncbi:response regulator transcription factor [Pasteurella skyensis]|uniref:Response regulator transcription factor n=1 Tax=Phocoenobacter skyensis TaxID=97481 RepID=A0AAJ6NAH0_9PAST|nr:response regulator transcription factor [Pasteurella skyensis]MDP8162724.1 response regulator transcription factor [Pasteurella skyensis]MDP8173195.1 response regulator transcription factor [Pasteurella skyensis]MDP8177588.1 response regulator transcription factor [Pasteurella skyensis]MDP8178826.1 response regulator transcription factor [Pasteurella skyensis]MDP8183126.1 response regulator transcription factor [Pasteurella skyensis]
MQQDISILIIDDDPQICELLCDTFDDYGYKVITASNGKKALSLLSQHPSITLIFLDLILPDINGLVLLQQLKSLSSAPIIMLSGLNTESDVVVGLEMGADDYIAKPFYPRVVVARAKAAIRRSQPQSLTPNPLFSATIQQGFKFDSWLLDTENHKLFSPSQTEVVLTQGEYILLNSLVCNARKVLSRQKLLELTHNESFEIFDRTIDVLIMRLRKKIEPNPKAPTYIKTIRGVGYLFDICCTPIK